MRSIENKGNATPRLLTAASLAVALTLVSAIAAYGQLRRVGDPFAISSDTRGAGADQIAAVAQPDGSFVVVWLGEGRDVHGRRFAADAGPLGTEFQVGANTSYRPGGVPGGMDAAADESGGFVVVWTSYDEAYCDYSYSAMNDVFGRELAADGSPLGATFYVNPTPCASQGDNALAAARTDTGDFVVVWDAFRSSSCGYDCGYSYYGYACGFDCSTQWEDADGSGAWTADLCESASECVVNTTTGGSQGNLAIDVAATPAQRFLVVWNSSQDGAGHEVYAQRFDETRMRLGTEFRVNTYTTGLQGDAIAVAAGADDGFLVAWTSEAEDGDGRGVFARAYDDDGMATGDPFQVNAYTTGDQGRTGVDDGVAVAADPAGGFLVAWSSNGQDGDDRGVFARSVGTTGGVRGDELQVNTYTTGRQAVTRVGSPVVASTDGLFVVTWRDNRPDANGYQVVGQRVGANPCPPLPRTLCHQAGRAKVVVVDKSATTEDRLRWVWNGGDGVELGELGDPTASTDYELCIYDFDQAGPAPVVGARAPAGTGWRSRGPAGFAFTGDVALTGLARIRLAPGSGAAARIKLKGAGELLTLGPAAAPDRLYHGDPVVLVQLVHDDGSCWDASFAHAKKHTARRFSANLR